MMDRNTVVEEHYRANRKRLVNMCLNRVPNNSRALAEEVVQEAYYRAMLYWDAFDPNRAEFKTWFNRILNSASVDCIREDRGDVSLDDDEVDVSPFILTNSDIPTDIVFLIRKGMAEQRPEVYDVLHMFFNLGFKSVDIEKCTDFTHTNIRQIIHRFKVEWASENSWRVA